MGPLLAAALLAAGASAPAAAAPRWWKGNLHAHSLWSDGDAAPERVAAWYAARGYHFLALTDHGTVQENGKPGLMRGSELRRRFDRPGEFLLLPGMELTDRFSRLPVHLNATGIRDHLPPLGGGSVLEVLQGAVDALRAQSARTGLPMLVQVNHPNFGWALTAEDLASLRGGRFFEVYNGHPLVRNEGGPGRPGTEELWDRALVLRRAAPEPEPLYGLAVDDSHDFAGPGEGRRPGRGWVMVRAERLEAGALIAAMEAGDFYASTGVALKRLVRGRGRLELEVEAEPGVGCAIEFVGARRGGPPGEVLARSRGPSASYRLRDGELYVRARVVSTKPKADPSREGEVETAWVQPVFPD